MSYCTLEEAWGSDFKKKHKKSKKEKENTAQEPVRSEETCMYSTVYIVFPTNIA